MQTKLLEIRDAGTFIPVMATLMESSKDEERYLLSRTGYTGHNTLVVVTRMNDLKTQYSSNDWGTNSRTMREAHAYIEDKWEELKSGDVVDVEFILGITDKPKESERITFLLG
jgi:hypothetical protein